MRQGIIRRLVVDEWMNNRNYECHLNDVLEAMDAILIAAGLTGKPEGDFYEGKEQNAAAGTPAAAL